MGIVREYTGDFSIEENYFSTLSTKIGEELEAIKNIVNNIEGDNIWNSTGASDSIENINYQLDAVNRVRENVMDEANKIFTSLDDLLKPYEK
jgi:hypothetical protein